MKEAKDLRIVFMGTPDFAVASLDAICKAGFQVVGVITAPDRPAGRGMKLTESAVKKYATENSLNVLQPVKLKDPDFLQALRSLEADLQIVVAFRMLPELVWNMPPMGTVNLHGSLLPQYRGAAPINWAIINGEKETGVTTFKLKQEIDTGAIIFQEKIPISPEETAGELKRVLQHRRFSKWMSDLNTSPQQVLAHFMNLATFVPNPVDDPGEIDADPFDNIFLALALEGKARLIISGDKHLLSLKEYRSIHIVTPSEAVRIIETLLK